MPKSKPSNTRQVKAAGKGRSIPVPGKIDVEPAVAKKISLPTEKLPAIGTAPTLRSKVANEHQVPKTRSLKPKIITQHAVRHIKILQAKSTVAAIKVGHGYRKADAVIVRTAKKAVPTAARERLQENHASNNGNLQFYIPIAPKIIPHKVKVVVPAKIRRIRHAALPVALIAVLVFAMYPAGAAPGYGGTSTIGGSGADEARRVAIDSQGNTYTAGTYAGTVNFSESWEAEPQNEVLFTDDFDDGAMDTWDDASYMTVSSDRSVSGEYSASAQMSEGVFPTANKQLALSGGVTVTSQVYFESTPQAFAFYKLHTNEFPGDLELSAYRVPEDNSLCVVNPYGDSQCSANDVLPESTWLEIRFEVRTDNTNGYMKAYINNELVVDYNVNTTDYSIAALTIGNNQGITGAVYYDDISVVATEGPHDKSTSYGGTQDGFITKTNADGSYGWTKTFSGQGKDIVHALTIDNEDNVYVGGSFENTLYLPRIMWSYTGDSRNSAGKADGFMTKINADGSLGWMKRVGGSENDAVTSLAVDSLDAVHVGGWFSDAIVLDEDGGLSNDMHISSGGSDGFIAQYDSTGVWESGAQIGSTSADYVNALAVDDNDNVYIAGSFTNQVDFGNAWAEEDVRDSAGDSDAFLTKIANGGGYLWTHVAGGMAGEVVTSLAVDSADNIYATGNFASEDLNFAADWSGSDEKSAASSNDGFIWKINANNTYGWTHVLGGNGTESIDAIGFDSEDNVYMGGSFDSTSFNAASDWGATDVQTSYGMSDAFVTRLGSTGSYGWTVNIGGTGSDALYGMAVDDDDVAHVVGSFSGTVDFGDMLSDVDSKTSAGSTDAFITRVNNNGSDAHTIADASGLTYEDEDGVNLSSTGTSESNATVYVRDQDDDTLLATVDANLSENRDWSAASGDSNRTENVVFISGIIGAPGAAATMTLYVPRDVSDKAVTLCPGVDGIEDVSFTCASSATYTDNDSGVDTVAVDSVEYWKISNIDDASIGAISRSFPGVSITETGGHTAITEAGLTDQVSVQLNAQPTDDVTVTITPSVGGRINSITPLTFTASNWDDPQLALLSPVDNNTITSANSFTLNYSTASADVNYDDTSESGVVAVDWTDNDTADVVWESVDSLTDESGDTADICLSLTAQPTDEVVLSLEPADTGEVTLSDDALTIAPEDWNATDNCVTAIGEDDDTTDGPQDVAISVIEIESDDTNFSSIDVGDIEAYTLTNQDNDTASFSVDVVGSMQTSEAGDAAEVCVQLSARPNSGSVTIPMSVSDATEASLSGSSLVIPAGSWNAADNCVTVTGEDDEMVDGDVQYQVITGDPAAADPAWDDLDANNIANPTLTNIDNDEAGLTITETDSSTNVVEGGATDTISVRPNTQPASGAEIVVNVQPSMQLSSGGVAGTATSLTFSESNWTTPQTVTISANNDTSVEGDHSGSVTFSIHEDTTEIPYESLMPEVVNVAITDNDTAIVSVATTDDTTESSSDEGVFEVSLSSQNNTGSAITVDYSVGGTATAGTHYDTLTGSATIANGQTSADIIVDTESHDNNLLEGNKTVIVTLTSTDSPNAEISEAGDSATVVVFDDETALASLTKTQDGDEDGPVDVTFMVTLSEANNTGIPIEFDISPLGGTAIAGSDYVNFAGGSIAVANGQTTGSFTVEVTDDAFLEASTETIQATISNPSLALVSIEPEEDSASATIADNDSAEIGVTATDDTAAENPPTPGEFTISLDKPNSTGSAVVVVYEIGGSATAGSDYNELSGEATIPNGQSSATIDVETDGHNDSSQEGNETVTISSLSTNLGGRITVGENSSATVTITDDEGANVLVDAIDDTTSETGETAKICFTLTSEPSADVTIALSSADTNKVTVPSSAVITTENWDAEDNCVTATGQDDTPPVATGTQNVVMITGDVTSADEFYDDLDGVDVEDVTIHHADDDTASVQVQVVDGETSEAGDEATVQFRLTSRPSSSVTILVAVTDVTEGMIGGVTEIEIAPEDWDDYAANEVVIQGVDDYLTDGTISYQMVTGNVASEDAAYNAIAADDVDNPTFTNVDDDEAIVTVAASGGATNVTEGSTTDTQSVQIGSQPAPGNEVVIRATPDNAQIDLGEGAGEAVELTFTNGNWQDIQTIIVTAIDDSLLESSHGAAVSYVIDTIKTTELAYDEYVGSLPVLNVGITDNDTATAGLSSSDSAEAGPSDGEFIVTLSKENNTGSAIIFALDPIGGTAVVGDDYDDFDGSTVSIANGETTGMVEVGIVDDSLLENNETILGEITDPSLGAVTIGSATASITITDNDTAEVSIIATDAAAAEDPSDNGGFTISLNKINNTGSSITVNYTATGTATANEDYEALSGSVVITNGSDEASVTVGTAGFNDSLIEGSEIVSLELDTTSHGRVSVGEPESAAVTISDDDIPNATVTASGGSTNVTEGGATDTQTVAIGTQPASGKQIVIVATPSNGQIDLGEGAGEAVELTFTNGNWQTPQTVTVEADDDSSLESAHNSSVVYTVNEIDTTENAYDDYEGLPTLSVSVTDNDTATANLDADNGSEAGTDSAGFTVTLSKTNHTGGPITFALDPSGGSANVADDYEDFTGTILSVANGAAIATRQVEIVDDTVLEGVETIEATLSNSSLNIVTIGSDSATANIIDDDTSDVTITATDATANENPSSNGTFTVSLGRTNHAASPISIEYTVSGTAVAGQDYNALPGVVLVPSGQYQAVVTVDTGGLNDDNIEGSETIIVTLDDADHPLVEVGDPDSATVNIIDDDTPSVAVTASGGSTNVTEGGVTDTQSIEIGTQPAAGKQVVIVATPADGQLNLGAGAGNPVERTFNESNWQDAQSITITAVDDTLLESAHNSSVTYTVNLDDTDDSDYLGYDDPLPVLNVAITDNDTASATLSAGNGSEAGPAPLTYTVTINKTNNTGSAITFALNPSGGSATVVSDYANFTGTTVSIANGATTGSANIGIVDDSLLEGSETVSGTISNPSLGAVTIGTATVSPTITDNDETDVTIVATDAAAAENPSASGQLTIYLDHVNNTGTDITVSYSVGGTATANNDYVALAGSVVIGHGQSAATITVLTTGLDDDTVEGNETVVVTLDGANHPLVAIGNPSTATVTIADDDSFAMNIETTTDGSEDGPVNIVYTVRLTHMNDTGQPITATLSDSGDGTAASGDDYADFSGTVSIPDGQQSVTRTVTVIDDDGLEGIESVEAILSNVSEGDIGVASATAVISDNDTAIATVTASDPTATENPSENGVFILSLTKPNKRATPIEFTYSVNGTATGGQDYAELSGQAMIADGQSSTMITVNTSNFNDNNYEGEETVVVTITSSNVGVVTIGDPNQATVIIADDDPAPKDPEAPSKNTGTTAKPRQVTSPPVAIIVVPEVTDEPTDSPAEQQPQPVDQIKNDLDDDGIADSEEMKATNHGDGNGDGIPDARQANVSSLISPVTKQPVTLEVWGECTKVQKFAVVDEGKLQKQDKRYRYPYGLVDYAIKCDDTGQEAHVTIYYDKQYADMARWRKFAVANDQFAELQSLQSLAQPIGDRDVSTVQYSLRDGGSNDDDGKADGVITDPAGPALRAFYLWDIGWILPAVFGSYFIGRSLHHRFRDHGLYTRR